MVVGLTVATPTGTLELGSSPANAAGPDLRQLVLGSEGAFGVITSVTVRVRKAPAEQGLRGLALAVLRRGRGGGARRRPVGPAAHGAAALRRGRVGGQPADPSAIAGSSAGSDGGCLMVVGFEGAADRVAERRAAVTDLLTSLGGMAAGEEPGRAWEHGRYRAPYLRDSMLDLGVLVETLETATFWSRVEDLYAAVKAALQEHLGEPAAGAVPRLARLRDRLLALLHRRRATGRGPRGAVAARQARRE